jgi:hypothetical protein
MAYMNSLYSVTERRVQAYRRDAAARLRPSLVVSVSHLVGYWVESQPLGSLLGEALDGGEPLSERLTHPFRAPVLHTPGQVQALYRRLADAWQNPRGPEVKEAWYRREISEVLRAFRHASGRSECIVSAVHEITESRRELPFVSAEDASDEEVADPQECVGLKCGDLAGWPVIGTVTVGVMLGVLSLCYWRYRRLEKQG